MIWLFDSGAAISITIFKANLFIFVTAGRGSTANEALEGTKTSFTDQCHESITLVINVHFSFLYCITQEASKNSTGIELHANAAIKHFLFSTTTELVILLIYLQQSNLICYTAL